jgi:hypothetical protein
VWRPNALRLKTVLSALLRRAQYGDNAPAALAYRLPDGNQAGRWALSRSTLPWASYRTAIRAGTGLMHQHLLWRYLPGSNTGYACASVWTHTGPKLRHSADCAHERATLDFIPDGSTVPVFQRLRSGLSASGQSSLASGLIRQRATLELHADETGWPPD